MKTLKDTIYKMTVPTPYPVGDVHLYLLEGDVLTLVDAGVKTEEAWLLLQKQLREIGYGPEDIEQIVLTHHHPDHMGLVNHFPRVHTVAAHPKLKPWMEKDENYFKRYEQFFHDMYLESGVPQSFYQQLNKLKKPLEWISKGSLSLEISEGDRLPGHEEWTVIETPGHAQSHLSFWRSCDGTLIGGDQLLAHISSNPLLEPPFKEGDPRPRPLLQYRESLKKLHQKGVKRVLPGHGESFEDVSVLIEERLAKQEVRAERVFKMFKDGPLTAYQVCERLFPKHIKTQLGLTMSETIGQLDYLEEAKKISSYFDGKQKFYDAVR
ncbi:MBL fold metallo-hydrolase [Halobacillus fulvus]|nr:MBL fold metallo-hydrolase [Halobacillus fulvus]